MNTLAVDPVVVDTELAADYAARAAAINTITLTLETIHRTAGDTRVVITPRMGRRQEVTRWAATDIAILDRARAHGAAKTYDQPALDTALGRHDTAATDRDTLNARIAELEAIHDTHGWSRFFLVPDGHIHSSRSCPTCNNGKYMTRFAWLPQWSGRTEADAIEGLRAAGGEGKAAVMCTVCYPSAPVAWTTAPVDASVCTGLYTYDPAARTTRRGFAAGNCATCTTCGAVGVALSTAGKLRKHARPGA